MSGSTVALITPMKAGTGEVDYAALRALFQHHIASRTDNLCVLGTTGEASVLTMDERERIIRIAVEECKGILPIIVGTGAVHAGAVKALTQQAIDLGCDAALVVTPYYVKPPQRCLIKHFLTCADFGLPIIVYNVPSRTGVDFKDENIAIISAHANIVGVKDATGDLRRLRTLRSMVGNNFLLLSGDDSTCEEFLRGGGDGCISVTANVAPALVHDMVAAAREGRLADSMRINASLKNLHEILFVESNPIPTKWALQRLGLIESSLARAPLDELDEVFHSEVESALIEAGLLQEDMFGKGMLPR